MDKFVAIVGAAVIGLIGLVFISFLLSWPVYMLWNGCLVDAVTVLKEVTWLQAWGINFLCGMLFKTTVSRKD
jgi:hypothetical protein